MVTEDTMTREQLREIDRQQRIDLALAAGNHKLAEWIRTEMEYDDDSTPEEDAEDARISAERIAKGKFVTLEEIEQWDAEHDPEHAAFFRRLDEEFPNWEQHVYDIPPDSPEGVEFLRRLKAEFPDALHMFPPYRTY